MEIKKYERLFGGTPITCSIWDYETDCENINPVSFAAPMRKFISSFCFKCIKLIDKSESMSNFRIARIHSPELLCDEDIKTICNDLGYTTLICIAMDLNNPATMNSTEKDDEFWRDVRYVHDTLVNNNFADMTSLLDTKFSDAVLYYVYDNSFARDVFGLEDISRRCDEISYTRGHTIDMMKNFIAEMED